MASNATVTRRKSRQLARRNVASLVVDTGVGIATGGFRPPRRGTGFVRPAGFDLPVAGGRGVLPPPPPSGGVPDFTFGGGRGRSIPGGGGSFDPTGGFDQDFTGVVCSVFEAGTLARRACEAAGGVVGGFLDRDKPSQPGSRPSGTGPCKEGTIRVGDQCIAIGDAFPGGDPFMTPAGGNAVNGSFGLPAFTPTVEQRTHRECPTGMVLGKDNLCYPKQVLPRRSKFRKWKGAKRPPISVRDANAIRRAERAKSRVKSLAKDVGFSVKKR